MKGPRFFPSGRRFGPYLLNRPDASVAPRPCSVLGASFFMTSSMGIAYQATISLAASAIDGSVMIGLSGQHGARLHTHIVRRVSANEIQMPPYKRRSRPTKNPSTQGPEAGHRARMRIPNTSALAPYMAASQFLSTQAIVT